MAAEQTLRQLAAPDVNYNGLCIKYSDIDVPFELKSGLIHLLPKFNGLAGEDPHKHLKEFQVVCSTPLRPEGITEDHVKLRAFPFSLQDFYILDMEGETNSSRAPIILGRPFMRTAKTKDNNLHTGEGEDVNEAVCAVEVLDIPDVPTKPSIDQPPSLELKPLPENLKYAYLEENEKPPVIISSNLDCEQEQEEKLLQVLKQHKKGIGWTLADIPGIIPTMCMNRILLEEEAKVVRSCNMEMQEAKTRSTGTGEVFKVNGQRLKLFHDSSMPNEAPVEELSLDEPSYTPAATP
ncbi:hypothetical protein L195_g036523 [Trifolium pratense]|uniref:Reverse transcriptase domain-containing protein n=1 Tax=Trifolium pratense TaxID=57577 RepID=A0A2K3LPQ0_TRIPR|nr:hypothetical protein L195_g036523 [Trifolium pratense]